MCTHTFSFPAKDVNLLPRTSIRRPRGKLSNPSHHRDQPSEINPRPQTHHIQESRSLPQAFLPFSVQLPFPVPLHGSVKSHAVSAPPFTLTWQMHECLCAATATLSPGLKLYVEMNEETQTKPECAGVRKPTQTGELGRGRLPGDDDFISAHEAGNGCAPGLSPEAVPPPPPHLLSGAFKNK